jgi:hypothetical protein
VNFDPQLAVEWLRYCSENHPQCHYDSHSRLPKRVLDCSGRSDSTKICLIETEGDHCAEYAALSYVWGSRQPILTLSANIAEHMAGIDITTLPNTLKDAVHVTRAIGLRYLWIDALCIVQDSTNDKATEIGLMNQYYKNAFCVIAATMSEDVMEGFLKTDVAGPLSSNIPPPDDITPQADLKHQVPFFSPDGEAGFLFLEANPTPFDGVLHLSTGGVGPCKKGSFVPEYSALLPRPASASYATSPSVLLAIPVTARHLVMKSTA